MTAHDAQAGIFIFGAVVGASWSTVSWVVWIALIVAMVVWELFTVYMEDRWGTLPLTRVVRDRLMRKSVIIKLGVLLFLTWLWIHFVTPLRW